MFHIWYFFTLRYILPPFYFLLFVVVVLMQKAPCYVIAGLGNHIYPSTRHSLGQTVLLGLSQKFGITLKEDRDVFGWVGQGVVSLSRGKNDQEASAGMIVLLKPRLLMNQSGKSVAKAMQKYTGGHLNHSQLIVLHDSLEHRIMSCSPKYQGSAEGHNGVRSCINHMSTIDNFMRIRLGIGKPKNGSPGQYVLDQLPFNEERFWKGEGTEMVWDIIAKRIMDLESGKETQ